MCITGGIRDSKIMIQKSLLFDGYNALFIINKISTEKHVNIANGQNYKNELIFNSNVSFGQLNNFKIKENIISYNFIGFSTKSLIKNTQIIMIVNLINGNELVEEEAICIALEDIEPKDGVQLPIKFECKIENIKNASKYSGLEIVKSDKISGIPTESKLLNPAIVDILIKEGKVENYTSEEFKNIVIPVFNATLIDTTDSLEKGVFVLIGEFLPKFKLEKRFEFEIILITGEKALCLLPKRNGDGEVKIECALQEEFKGGKIMIGQFSVLDGYNPLIQINKISSKEKVKIGNGKEIKLRNKLDINLSFGQVNNFKVVKEEIIFIFIGFITEELKKNDTIEIIVDLIKGKEFVRKKAKCTALANINPNNGLQLEIEFECKVESVINASEYIGLEVVSSDDISGIPTDSDLLNPVIVDELIEQGIVENYTTEDYKNKKIPIFNGTSIDTTDSKQTGTFILIGELLTEFTLKKRFEFSLILITGEKVICTLPKINGKVEVKIKCILQEELKDSKIMIEQCSILNKYKELIRINKISSIEKITIGNGREIQLQNKFKVNLSFGQVNYFKVVKQEITFIFVGLTTELLAKDKIKFMIVNLIKDDELVEEEAKCISKENIIPKDGKQIPVEFECKIENVKNASEYTSLEVVSSDDINGIPNDSDLLNPVIVDELIKEGLIENYTTEEYKNNSIPIFNGTSIDTSNSRKTGAFFLIGQFLSEFTLKIRFIFELFLMTGEKALCTLPKINGKVEVKIECILQEELKDSIIMIEQRSVFDEYKELIRINKISIDQKVSIADGKQINFKRIFNNHLSFRQTNTFEFDSSKNSVSFIINVFTTEAMKKEAYNNIFSASLFRDAPGCHPGNPDYSSIARCIRNTTVIKKMKLL